MEPTEEELEDLLKVVGISLGSPPAGVGELLRLLDQTEIYLSRVEQSPSPSMFDALRPAMNLLISSELLNHPDTNVKVFVAACINEIIRITAPVAPYSDSLMKVIFAVIVDAFGKLDEMSGPSYPKKVSILETLAKVRSCVVMLDLECDELILQMFKHFLKSIRPDHSINVFSSMETIMTLVLEDSEYISEELLHCLLSYVHKSKKDVMPVSCKLSETVISNCAMKLKPNLMDAVKLTGICLNDYTDKVASICQECSVSPEQNEVEESKLPERTVHNEFPQESKNLNKSDSCFEEFGAFADKARKVPSDSRMPLGNGNPIVEPVSSEFKHENSSYSEQCKNNIVPRTEDINLDSINEISSIELDLKHVEAKSSSVQLPDASDSSRVEDDKEASSPTPRKVGQKRQGKSLKLDDMAPNTEVLLDPEREVELRPLEGLVSDNKYVISATAGDNVLGRGQKRKTKSLKSDGASNIAPKTTDLLEPGREIEFRTLEGPDGDSTCVISAAACKDLPGSYSPSSVKSTKSQVSAKRNTPHKTALSSGKKKMSENIPMEESLAIVSEHKEDHCSVSNFDKKPSPGLPKRSLEDNATADVSTTVVGDGIGFQKQWKSGIRQPKFKDAAEGGISAEPCLKTSGQRIHVGRNIEVWWPDDRRFYKAVIELFDPVKQKHKVVYEDGDVEFLYLGKECWNYIDSENLEKGHEDDGVSQETSLQVQKKPPVSSVKFKETPETGTSGRKLKGTPILQTDHQKPAIKLSISSKRETSKVATSSNEKTKEPHGSDTTKVDVSPQANNSNEPLEDNTSSKVKSDVGKSVIRSRRRLPKSEKNQQTVTKMSGTKNDTSQDAAEVKSYILTPAKLEVKSEGEPEERFGGRSRRKSDLKSTGKPISRTSDIGIQTDPISFEDYIALSVTHKILERNDALKSSNRGSKTRKKKKISAVTTEGIIDLKNSASEGANVDDSGASGSQRSAVKPNKRHRK